MSDRPCHACGAMPLPPIQPRWCYVTPGKILYKVGEIASTRNKQIYLMRERYADRTDIPTAEGNWQNARVAHFERWYSNTKVLTGGELLHYTVEKPDDIS